jgi:hypothetical protein
LQLIDFLACFPISENAWRIMSFLLKARQEEQNGVSDASICSFALYKQSIHANNAFSLISNLCAKRSPAYYPPSWNNFILG